MADSLVIVESPGKVRTIKKHLGSDYQVMSSVGHVRDLPKSGRKNKASKSTARPKLKGKALANYRERQKRNTLVERMGVNPDKDWRATYEVLPDKIDVVEKLRDAAKKVSKIYLATDLDREGEAIAWHLQEVIGGEESKFIRVVFNEITESAIQRAFADPGKIDMNRVNAQQARRFLDRVVGFELTPLLYAKVARGLSAGRVQSVAVRLIVEREREIRAFTPEEYWEANAQLLREGQSLAVDAKDSSQKFEVTKYRDERFRPTSELEATALLDEMAQQTFRVAKHETKINLTRPPAPFKTTTLQQTASTRLNFSVSRTMNAAQRLYEAGLITYMRTDSTNVAQEAIDEVRNHIRKSYPSATVEGKLVSYLPDRPNVYRSNASSQEAHEAIRPTSVSVRSVSQQDLTRDAVSLYDLIWRRFVACQMSPARFKGTTTTVRAGEFELRRSTSIRIFDGFQRVYNPNDGEKDAEIRALDVDYQVDEVLQCGQIEKEQHFTKPPSRFSEARLIRELERRGIGRPSTYASIISTIQERGYVTLHGKQFSAELIGEVVTDRLVECFENVLSYDFTAKMETDLDQIAEGQKAWKDVLNLFYGDFAERLRSASDADHGMRNNEPLPTDVVCDKCGRHMMLRVAKTGVFLGCSGYSLPPKDRCTNTKNLIPDVSVEKVLEENEESASSAPEHLLTRKKCSICGSWMNGSVVDASTKIHICTNFPSCPGYEIETGQFEIKGYEGPVVECDKCGSDMHLRNGRFGKFFGCTNENCSNTRKMLRNGQVAPPKADPVPMPELKVDGEDDFYVLRDGARGIFLAASKFPQIRKTRQVSVSELLAHGNELDPKFKYLLTAPEQDSKGGTYVVRFSRTSNEQYVASEKNGKPNGWTAFYKDGHWVANKQEPKLRRQRRQARAR